MKGKTFSVFIIIFYITLSSCVSNPTYFNKTAVDRSADKIVVLPFGDFNTNEGNNSGELVRSNFESKLILKKYNVIEIEKLASIADYSVLKKHEFSGKWIMETGKAIGADYMIYGSVHDYRIYQNLTSFLYLFSWLEVTSSVGVTARMVSCRTGEVVWSGTSTRSSYSFNDAAADTVNTLVRTIRYKKGE